MKLMQGILIIFVALLLIGGSQAIYVVDQTEQAIVLRFGEPTGDIKQPGLHFMIPVVEKVRSFDNRILSVDPQPEQMVISSSNDNPLIAQAPEGEDPAAAQEEAIDLETVSGEPIIVDTFARYRITDPLLFTKTLRTIHGANQRLENIMNDATRSVLGKTTMRELLSEERTAVMLDIRERVNKKIAQDKLGIDIIDIRIVRADLTPALRQATVRRMKSELLKRATETRAKGEERAKEIRAAAERERTVLLAEASRDAQILRGEGDNEAIKIYADAFNKDKDFYGFMRSMEAYKNTLADPDTRLILSPDSEFFRYFKSEQ